MVLRPYDLDDVLTAFDELAVRWTAYGRAVSDAGQDPDEETRFAIWELELSLHGWRERFVAALARRGMTLEEALGPVA